MDLPVGEYELKNFSLRNVLLGKNGCGKSFCLKQIASALRAKENIGKVSYLSPERGGSLAYEAGIEQAIGSRLSYLDNERHKNQAQQFRQQSVALFRRLELLFHRANEVMYQSENKIVFFQKKIDQLNVLLDRVFLERAGDTFEIFDKIDRKKVGQETLSSGESELISLGIEILFFEYDASSDKDNFLLIDEPDVHLHPDLQERLANFMDSSLENKKVHLIVATHSTSFVASLAKVSKAHVCFMQANQKQLNFIEIGQVLTSMLPVLGAHSLSAVLNEKPILLVEGEDEQRVWQQAIKTSEGKIKLWPCDVGGESFLSTFETMAAVIIQAVYDKAVGYSVRDGDNNPGIPLDDNGPICRIRIHCRSLENLLLSDDALQLAGTNWEEFKAALILKRSDHECIERFISNGMDRRNGKLKECRHLFAYFMWNKPWDVIVGKAIANLVAGKGLSTEDSLRAYLGEKACEKMLKVEPFRKSDELAQQPLLASP